MDWSLEGRETSLRPQPDDAGHPGEGCARAGAQGYPVRFHTCLRVPVGPLLEATPDQRLFSLIEGVFRADPENTALSPGDPGGLRPGGSRSTAGSGVEGSGEQTPWRVRVGCSECSAAAERTGRWRGVWEGARTGVPLAVCVRTASRSAGARRHSLGKWLERRVVDGLPAQPWTHSWGGQWLQRAGRFALGLASTALSLPPPVGSYAAALPARRGSGVSSPCCHHSNCFTLCSHDVCYTLAWLTCFCKSICILIV